MIWCIHVKFGLTTGEAHRWRVTGKMVLRIIFEPDKVEVIGDWWIARTELYTVIWILTEYDKDD